MPFPQPPPFLTSCISVLQYQNKETDSQHWHNAQGLFRFHQLCVHVYVFVQVCVEMCNHHHIQVCTATTRLFSAVPLWLHPLIPPSPWDPWQSLMCVHHLRISPKHKLDRVIPLGPPVASSSEPGQSYPGILPCASRPSLCVSLPLVL